MNSATGSSIMGTSVMGASVMGTPGGEFLGRMRERITLESRAGADDGLGGLTRVWRPVAQVWAAIEMQAPGEAPHAGGISHALRYRLVVRRRAALSPAWRIAWRNRHLAITAVDAVPGRADLALLTARELPEG